MKRASKRLSSKTGEKEPSLPARNAQSESPGLYLVATPIGNARDITLRGLDVLKSCDLIAAEDTRVTSRLLSIHGISKPLTAYNDHNGARERPRLIAKLRAGARIALVSDAGTPLVSDPGYKLVREVLDEDLAVHAVPGPSAVMTALMLSGLSSARFCFVGFLPPKSGERRSTLLALRNVPATLIAFESPQRLAESLRDISEALGNRQAAIARELTKLHEEIRRGTLDELAAQAASEPPPKGEITVVIAPPEESEPDYAKAEALLAKTLKHLPLRTAVDFVVEALELPRGEIYSRALALKAADEG
ncbi:MAG: 16S rRNA (cytidine(1402)-2'-O)-methyltransferase [Alphaproteobacteria bacterium]|nr:16S rRNA (cytidine(1402)-2'-O)-methyltransferase [Alphaproteobacteria bacterium]